MKERQKIGIDMSVVDVMMLMSEGNPGAISVMAEILKKDPANGLMYILDLDDMNIRGTQIWVGYKDYCNQNLDEFMKCVGDRDHKMVGVINAEGKLGNHEEIAVTSGASYTRPGAISRR